MVEGIKEYSEMTFEELNGLILERKDETEEEVISWTISKGIEAIEMYLWKTARVHGIRITENDIEEIINQMLDNVTEYFTTKLSYNLKSYMYTTAQGKFLNYFRDNIKDISVVSYNEKVSSEGDGEEEHIAFFIDENSLYNENFEERIMIKAAFGELKEQCRKSIYLRKVLNYSIEEIKTSMKLVGMSEENIRKIISNCMKKLKELVYGGVEK